MCSTTAIEGPKSRGRPAASTGSASMPPAKSDHDEVPELHRFDLAV